MLKFARIASGLFIGIFALLVSSFRAQEQVFEVSKNIDILITAYRELQANYVDEIDNKKTINKGIQTMLASLDPYTEFIPEDKIDDFKRSHLSFEYAGIGAYIATIRENITVTEVYEGFPAQKAGVIPGDVILKINNQEIKGKKSDEVSSLLRDPKNSTVNLLIKRIGQLEPVSFSIRRESVNTGNVSYSGIISNDIIYIKLDRFMEDAAKQVKTALTQLKNQQKISGIILDLRGNGGGILAEAVKISNLFIKQGTLIVSQKGKRQKNNADYVATNPPIDTETPLVVLVDQGSASASEVVTGAIQDTDRGIIIGQRTFGKGLVQNTVQIAYNSLLKLTIAKYYTPSGRCIQALDYTHRRSDGSVEKVADSLISEFKTSNGRLVYDGSGIFPDIEITSKDAPAVARALHEKYLFFRFANEFHFKNKSIPSATEFSLNDAQYKSFIDFVRDEKFEYTTETEEKMRNLREAMDKDLIKESGKLSDALLGKIKEIKETELIRNKKLISEILEAEIALRYYFQKGRIESTFDDDEEIAQAIKTIRNPNLIKDILTGKGEFKTIGKPKAIEKSVEAAVMESNEGEQ